MKETLAPNQNQLSTENNSFIPSAVINFLEKIGLHELSLKPEDLSLSYKHLSEAYQEKGYPAIQNIKVQHLKNIAAAREKLESGIPMKFRAQMILQENHQLGDQTTWMLRSLDTETTLAVTKFLFQDMKREELWMGFAMNEDWVDPQSSDRSQVTPLVKGLKTIKDTELILKLMQGKISPQQLKKQTPKLYGKNQNQENNTIENLHHFNLKYLAGKLASKYLASNPDYQVLSSKEKNQRYKAELKKSYATISQIKKGNKSWKNVNRYLKLHNQKPISPETPFFIKLFAQDRPNWKITDIMITQNSFVLETNSQQYTPRNNNSENKKLSNEMIRIEIRKQKSKDPIIYTQQNQIKWLKPLLNRPVFFQALDEDVVKPLSDSPYQQIQVMLSLGASAEHMQSPSSPMHKLAFENGKPLFATDIIWGVDKNNSKNNTQKPLLTYPLLQQIDLEKTPILPPSLKQFENSFYQLIKRTSSYPTHTQPTARDIGKAKLFLKHWQNIRKTDLGKTLPPNSAKKYLKEVAEQKPLITSPKRTLTILERQLSI